MSTPDFDTQVNDAIKNRSEVDGKMQFAEDLDPAIKYAANAEIRRRDTQSAFTKTQQENQALKTENEQLFGIYETETVKKFTEDEQAELEELKHTDQEAWRAKINELEASNRAKAKEQHAQIKNKASEETEMQRRERVLTEHNDANPNFALTDDVIDNDIPPRITKKLEKGEITFEEYISECHTYLSAGKRIHTGDPAPDEPDLNQTPGSSTPTDEAVGKSISESYKDTIF